jgi:hypothetical protein
MHDPETAPRSASAIACRVVHGARCGRGALSVGSCIRVRPDLRATRASQLAPRSRTVRRSDIRVFARVSTFVARARGRISDRPGCGFFVWHKFYNRRNSSTRAEKIGRVALGLRSFGSRSSARCVCDVGRVPRPCFLLAPLPTATSIAAGVTAVSRAGPISVSCSPTEQSTIRPSHAAVLMCARHRSAAASWSQACPWPDLGASG